MQRPRTGDILNSQADISAAAEAFGYRPLIGLKEGLERTVEWYRETLKLPVASKTQVKIISRRNSLVDQQGLPRWLSLVEKRELRVGIIGLGYVGLPLVLLFSQEGFRGHGL